MPPLRLQAAAPMRPFRSRLVDQAMTRSATDVMQDIVFSAVVDALDALKSASKGVPNTLLRDVGAIHVNATFADLPKEVQTAILASVRSAFNRLNKEGYAVAPRDAAPPVRRPPRPETGTSGRPEGPRRTSGRPDDARRRPGPPGGRTPPSGPRGPRRGPKTP